MSTGGAFNSTTTGTTRDSQGGVFNNVNSSVSADAGTGSGDNSEILALIAAETQARIDGDDDLAAEITIEIAARMAADATLQTNIDAKQNELTAGTNITIINDVIASTAGGGSAPIITIYTLRLDFVSTQDQPVVVVNTGTETPTVDFTADSISSSEIPGTSDVNVNGIPFILNTDYIISSGILQFADYDLVPRDGDVIVISATIVS